MEFSPPKVISTAAAPFAVKRCFSVLHAQVATCNKVNSQQKSVQSAIKVYQSRKITGLRSACISRQKIVPKISASVDVNNIDVIDGMKDDRPIVVIDNYDSFTYNLCQYVAELGVNFIVYRNDEISVEEIKRMLPRGILISPGPGTPQDSGISLQTVLELGPSIPLFGVCMGLQCIGEAFGGKIVRSPYGVVHGKSSLVYYNEKLDGTLFSGLPNPFEAGRYHSLVIEKDSFPHDALEIVAWTEDGLVMAARHRKYKHIQGVQFHPESIITKEGKSIVQNFVKNLEETRGLHSLAPTNS